MNITLIGFMGCGKTAVARSLAGKMRLRYLSTDELIEKREKRSIREIFEKEGEGYFRRIEKEAVEKLSSVADTVVDAGGGVVLDSENMANLKKCGRVILLEATPEVILKRTGRCGRRPLLNVPDPKKKITELLQFRAPFYRRADVSFDTSRLSVDEVAEKIMRYLKGISEKGTKPKKSLDFCD